MKTIAIIPARGGSKGIPRKNAMPLQGKPLVSWCIDTVHGSTYIDEVYVSTDDKEIASISKKNGARVILRPEALAQDESTSESALLHALESFKHIPELLVFLQCTSPLTQPEDIDAAIEKLINENADTCFSVTSFHGFLWSEKSDGTANGINHDPTHRLHRQECDSQYHENGAIYVMKTSGFLKFKHRFFGKTVMSTMLPERSLEIDTPFDLSMADYLMSR